MALTSDFLVIREASTLIGDGAPANDREEREIPFRVTDIERGEAAILHFEIRNLTVATEDPAVEINNVRVGSIQRNALRSKGSDGEAGFWYHQSMVIPANRIRNGDNMLEITAPGWADSHTGDRFDDFQIRNVVLHYKTRIDARTLSTA